MGHFGFQHTRLFIWALLFVALYCVTSDAVTECKQLIRGQSMLYGLNQDTSALYADQARHALQSGRIAKLNTYYSQETGCIIGVKPLYGFATTSGQLLGMQKGTKEKSWMLGAHDVVNRVDIKYDKRCIRYIKFYTSGGASEASGSALATPSSKLAVVLPLDSNWQLLSFRGTTADGLLQQLQFVWGEVLCADHSAPVTATLLQHAAAAGTMPKTFNSTPEALQHSAVPEQLNHAGLPLFNTINTATIVRRPLPTQHAVSQDLKMFNLSLTDAEQALWPSANQLQGTVASTGTSTAVESADADTQPALDMDQQVVQLSPGSSSAVNGFQQHVPSSAAVGQQPPLAPQASHDLQATTTSQHESKIPPVLHRRWQQQQQPLQHAYPLLQSLEQQLLYQQQLQHAMQQQQLQTGLQNISQYQDQALQAAPSQYQQLDQQQRLQDPSKLTAPTIQLRSASLPQGIGVSTAAPALHMDDQTTTTQAIEPLTTPINPRPAASERQIANGNVEADVLTGGSVPAAYQQLVTMLQGTVGTQSWRGDAARDNQGNSSESKSRSASAAQTMGTVKPINIMTPAASSAMLDPSLPNTPSMATAAAAGDVPRVVVKGSSGDASRNITGNSVTAAAASLQDHVVRSSTPSLGAGVLSSGVADDTTSAEGHDELRNLIIGIGGLLKSLMNNSSSGSGITVQSTDLQMSLQHSASPVKSDSTSRRDSLIVSPAMDSASGKDSANDAEDTGLVGTPLEPELDILQPSRRTQLTSRLYDTLATASHDRPIMDSTSQSMPTQADSELSQPQFTMERTGDGIENQSSSAAAGLNTARQQQYEDGAKQQPGAAANISSASAPQFETHTNAAPRRRPRRQHLRQQQTAVHYGQISSSLKNEVSASNVRSPSNRLTVVPANGRQPQ